MNLPLDKLKRDELYTFICGLFVGLAWHLYFQEIGWVAKSAEVIDSSLLLAWLFGTGLLYIGYSVLAWVSDSICRSRIGKLKEDDDNRELQKMGLQKYVSFFWAGPLEEQYLLMHIAALLTVAMILIGHPLLAFVSSKVTSTWFLAIQVVYSLATVAAYVMLSEKNHYLHQVKHFLDKGYCDTLDQAYPGRSIKPSRSNQTEVKPGLTQPVPFLTPFLV